MRSPLRIALALALVLAASTVPLLAAQPWEFESSADRKRVEERERSVTRAYKDAVEALEGEAGFDRTIVIEQLKYAISEKSESMKFGAFGGMGLRGGYYPYFYLGLAYAMAGDWASAKACLDREDAEKIRDARKLKPLFDGLAVDVAAMSRVAEARQCAQVAISSAAGKGGMVFFSRGAADHARQLNVIVGRNEGLAEPPGRGALAAAANTFRESVEGHVFALYEDEMGKRRQLLKALGGESWRKAGVGAVPAAAMRACEGGGETCSSAEQRALQCARSAASVLRPALDEVCTGVDQALAGIRGAQGAAEAWARAIGKSAPSRQALPGKPPLCGAIRAQGLAAVVSAPSGALEELPGTLVGLRTIEVQAERSLDEQRGAARSAAQRALGGVAPPKATCARALGLGDERTALSRWRGLLTRGVGERSPPKGFGAALGGVPDAWDRFREEALEGARSLLAAPAPEATPESLEALRGEIEVYAGSPRAADDLTRLCDAAAPVAGATKLAEEAEEARQEAFRAALGLAQAWDEGSAEGERGCASSLATALAEDEDETLLDEVESCFAETEEQAAKTTRTLKSLADTLGSFPELAARFEAAFSTPLDAGGTLAEALGEDQARALALWEFAERGPVSRQEMNAAARTLGLERAPSTWERWVETIARSSDELATRGARLARVTLVRAAADAQVEEALEEHGAILESVRAALAVREALEQVDGGDLDRAIRELRAVSQQPLLDARGRGAALVDATLAYLLRLRARAEAPGSVSHTALTEESTLFLGRAATSAPELELPAQIFPESFRDAWRRAIEGGR